MASVTSLNISSPRVSVIRAGDNHRSVTYFGVGMWQKVVARGRMQVARAALEKILDQVDGSIKQAGEACSGDPTSGECVAAWDEVEELSVAASHARDRKKENSDRLETYCKDNPETDECRTLVLSRVDMEF